MNKTKLLSGLLCVLSVLPVNAGAKSIFDELPSQQELNVKKGEKSVEEWIDKNLIIPISSTSGYTEYLQNCVSPLTTGKDLDKLAKFMKESYDCTLSALFRAGKYDVVIKTYEDFIKQEKLLHHSYFSFSTRQATLHFPRDLVRFYREIYTPDFIATLRASSNPHELLIQKVKSQWGDSHIDRRRLPPNGIIVEETHFKLYDDYWKSNDFWEKIDRISAIEVYGTLYPLGGFYRDFILARSYEKLGDKEKASNLYARLWFIARYVKPSVLGIERAVPQVPLPSDFEEFFSKKVDELGYTEYKTVLVRYFADLYNFTVKEVDANTQTLESFKQKYLDSREGEARKKMEEIGARINAQTLEMWRQHTWSRGKDFLQRTIERLRKYLKNMNDNFVKDMEEYLKGGGQS